MKEVTFIERWTCYPRVPQTLPILDDSKMIGKGTIISFTPIHDEGHGFGLYTVIIDDSVNYDFENVGFRLQYGVLYIKEE